ncbi:MAG TPA: hypothetical protein VFJ58_29250 [Armatimonadota bacterium]|nr:hypothetical protein [Armatimonadota bacterium]
MDLYSIVLHRATELPKTAPKLLILAPAGSSSELSPGAAGSDMFGNPLSIPASGSLIVDATGPV